MLLNVHITPRALVETTQSEAQFNAPALRRDLVELLLRHGVMRFTSSDEAGRWIDSLGLPDLTPAEKKEWQQLLLSLKKQGRLSASTPPLITDAEAASTLAEVEGLTKGAPMLSVLGEATYRRLFPDATSGHAVPYPGLEITVPGSVADSKLYQRLRDLVDTGRLPEGTPRTEVWNSLFGPLASVSKEITIFDKYLLSRLFETGDEHVTWMLKNLNEVAPEGAGVVLIAARGTEGQYGAERIPSDAREAERLLREYLPDTWGRLGSVQVVFAESTRARHMHHDRHIRFSAGAAIEVPAGFDRLDQPRLRDSFGFTYRWSPAALAELESREQEVKRARGTHIVRLKAGSRPS